MDVVLADDHAIVREGLIPFLKGVDENVIVTEAESFDEALQAARRAADLRLVVLDLYMPGMNGISGLHVMRRQFPKVPVLVLSGSTEPSDAIRVMENGAAGYIPKTMRGSAMQRVFRLVMDGERYVPPFLLETVHRPAAQRARERRYAAGRLSALSPREIDILRGLVDGAPNKQIARDLDLQEVTVKAHLRSIFRKLSVRNRTEAAMMAQSEGLTGRNSTSFPQSSGSDLARP